MKLKNSALQELYDAIFGGNVKFTVVEESPIDKVFRECDEKLSESITFATIKDLQDRNDILEESNKSLLAGNLNLSTEKCILKNQISRLEELLLDANTNLEKANADRTNLQEAFDKLSEENNEIIKERDDAKKNVEYFRHRRDDWMVGATHAEKEVKDLASQYQKLTIENKRLQDAKTTIEKANADLTELREDYAKLIGENRRLNVRTDCLRLEVNWYRKHYRENLNKLLNTARDDGYESGQEDLWDKLKEVSDYYYFGGDDEFDTDDCEMTSMTDIIDNLNVNQFLEAYKNWHKAQEQPWECTIEGTINAEINKDLLNKVFGIDSDD